MLGTSSKTPARDPLSARLPPCKAACISTFPLVFITTRMYLIAESAQHARPPATLLDDILWCVTDNLAAVRIDSGSGTAPAALYAW
jgi:hypothetical protein